MSTEPKPCPFCGKTSVTTVEGSTFRWVYASCDHCGAQAGEVRKDTLADDRARAQKDAERKAIKKWNQRVGG